MKPAITISELLSTLPQQGIVEWIGLRPARREPLQSAIQVQLTVDSGLVGDRYAGRSRKRQVTLLQYEHLNVIASMLHRDNVDPALLRRNLCVSGINLLALKGKRFTVGTAVLECTGLCHPCSRMEETFGAGGYNAVRGHGGITACVVESGSLALHDTVTTLT
ncbi:MAG: MOSC domain-containing protein [Granulosicoccus sp.]